MFLRPKSDSATLRDAGAQDLSPIYLSPDVAFAGDMQRSSDSLDGSNVISELVEGSDGYLYGSAFSSSNTQGSVFRLAKDGSSFAVLHRFEGGTGDGKNPGSSLAETQNGVFYGTTMADGANAAGVIFRIATTVEGPRVKVRGSLRPVIRGRTLRLRGTASDDLDVVRVEYSTRKAYKPAKGTTAWSARIPVKPSAKRVTVRVRALDSDAQLSSLAILRARRAK